MDTAFVAGGDNGVACVGFVVDVTSLPWQFVVYGFARTGKCLGEFRGVVVELGGCIEARRDLRTFRYSGQQCIKIDDPYTAKDR